MVRQMTGLYAIGLMSGTSMDGIDVAALRTDGGTAVERGPAKLISFDPGFRRTLEDALSIATSARDSKDRPGKLSEIERQITLRHVEAVRQFLAEIPPAWQKPDLIGFHGQTVLHRPQAGVSIQLGDGRLLARETGTPVVFDMRADDLRQGGQGAPLAPAYHAALAAGLKATGVHDYPMVFVNIGGISNITYVDGTGDPIAFDSGPGNALIDQWVNDLAGIPFDSEGAIASEGVVSMPVVADYLDSPFFSEPAPKSLDRNDFGLELAKGLELSDGARTLARVSAEAILRAADMMPEPPKLWVVCGGGRKNACVMADLKAGAEQVKGKVVAAEEVGIDGDTVEAEAWAYLAVRARRGLPLTWPTTTGCKAPISGGVFAEP